MDTGILVSDIISAHESESPHLIEMMRWFTVPVVTLCAWLSIIIICLRPFSFVENEYIQRLFYFTSVSRTTLMKYIHKLPRTVEVKIAETFPSIFAIVVDGCSWADTHSFSIYPFFPTEKWYGYTVVLLSFGRVDDEDRFDAGSIEKLFY